MRLRNYITVLAIFMAIGVYAQNPFVTEKNKDGFYIDKSGKEVLFHAKKWKDYHRSLSITTKEFSYKDASTGKKKVVLLDNVRMIYFNRETWIVRPIEKKGFQANRIITFNNENYLYGTSEGSTHRLYIRNIDTDEIVGSKSGILFTGSAKAEAITEKIDNELKEYFPESSEQIKNKMIENRLFKGGVTLERYDEGGYVKIFYGLEYINESNATDLYQRIFVK